MRRINKGQEPPEWTEYKLTRGVEYQRIPELADSLLKEQGYICAYCMRHIPVRDTMSNETSKIDHILSRTNHSDKELDYSNMVICCPGAINQDIHCDTKKGENDVTFDLLGNAFFTTLEYKRGRGKILSTNTEYNRQINDCLNLNNTLLMENRIEALTGVINSLKPNEWTKSNVRKLIRKWENKGSNGKYNEYCGIVVWYLNMKINQCK